MDKFIIFQRLYTEDQIYGYITGLYEGDGYITISKKERYKKTPKQHKTISKNSKIKI